MKTETIRAGINDTMEIAVAEGLLAKAAARGVKEWIEDALAPKEYRDASGNMNEKGELKLERIVASIEDGTYASGQRSGSLEARFKTVAKEHKKMAGAKWADPEKGDDMESLEAWADRVFKPGAGTAFHNEAIRRLERERKAKGEVGNLLG